MTYFHWQLVWKRALLAIWHLARNHHDHALMGKLERGIALNEMSSSQYLVVAENLLVVEFGNSAVLQGSESSNGSDRLDRGQ